MDACSGSVPDAGSVVSGKSSKQRETRAPNDEEEEFVLAASALANFFLTLV